MQSKKFKNMRSWNQEDYEDLYIDLEVEENEE